MAKDTKNKVLLIEDDAQIIDVYQITFKTAGFDMETISWGNKAIEEVKKMQDEKRELPDIVLIDLMLPDINGIKILEFIRANEKTKELPVFILTNYTDQEMEKLGLDLKSEKHILKAAVTPREVADMVKERLK